MREARRAQQESNPHYLKPDSVKRNELDLTTTTTMADEVGALVSSHNIPGLASSDKYFHKTTKKSKTKKMKKKRAQKLAALSDGNEEESEKEYAEENEERNSRVFVNRGRGEMPEGAEDSGDETEERRDSNDPHVALDIDLEG